MLILHEDAAVGEEDDEVEAEYSPQLAERMLVDLLDKQMEALEGVVLILFLP